MGGLSVRGIRNFNISLLGKNYKRLLTVETSLLSKVLKDRYYPRALYLLLLLAIPRAMLGGVFLAQESLLIKIVDGEIKIARVLGSDRKIERLEISALNLKAQYVS